MGINIPKESKGVSWTKDEKSSLNSKADVMAEFDNVNEVHIKISSTDSNIVPTPGDRGISSMGGFTGAFRNNIDFVTISSPSNATDFGDLTGSGPARSLSNSTSDRGVANVGPGFVANTLLNFITISNISDATLFGNLVVARLTAGSCSNATNDRGIFSGGSASINNIDFITISTTGDGLDFGDLTVGRRALASASNGTADRGVNSGGSGPLNVMDFVTISTQSNATDYGDLTSPGQSIAATSNNTNDRQVVSLGNIAPTAGVTTTLNFSTISTLSNATFFGDLITAGEARTATSNAENEIGIFSGGGQPTRDSIEKVTISTASNSVDFGNLTVTTIDAGSCSNG